MEGVRQAGQVAAAQLKLLLGEHDDGASLGRLVRERGELRRVRQVAIRNAGRRMEGRGLAIAERDRAGLVEQQHVDVARGLHGAAGGRDHVGAHHAIHAGDADGGEQSADRGRDETDEQCDEHDQC